MAIETQIAALVTASNELTQQVLALLNAGGGGGGGTDPQVLADITALETSVTTLTTNLSALDATVASLSGGGGTDPQVLADITALETSVATLTADLTALTAVVAGLSGGGSGTDPQVLADIAALQSGLAATNATLTALQTTVAGLSGGGAAYTDLAVSPNRIYASRHFNAFCNGTLNTPLVWNAGGVNTPYQGFFAASAAGTLTIEVVDMQDTARLSALGIAAVGAPFDIYGSQATRQFYIAVFDMTVTTAPIAGTVFSLVMGPLPWLSDGSNTSSGTTGESSCFFNAMAISAGFSAQLRGTGPASAFVSDADVGAGWVHRQGSGPIAQAPGITMAASTAQPAGGTIQFAIALPYYGLGNHGGLPVWTEAIQDVIDGI